MKIFLLLLCALILNAKEWEVKNIILQTENDADFRTDRDYTYGSEVAILYATKKNSYLSFCIAHQMFTPKDFDKENVDYSKERPYAGYLYFGVAQHLIQKRALTSYNLQVGFVGPSVKMDKVQKIIHDIIGSPEPKNWENQIGDELILQLNVERRWFKDFGTLFGYESSLVHFAGANVGNLSIKASYGAIYTLSKSMKKSFGALPIDYKGYSNIPLNDVRSLKSGYKIFLFLEGNIVLRNLFLDGNTFKESPSVEKNIFVAQGGFGFGYCYKKFEINYLHTFLTKEFKTQNYYHGYGSLIFSYNF